VRLPANREPTHPGEILRAEFLEPMGISQRELSDGIHVPYQRVNELVNQKRGVTPSMALRLAKFFNVSADYWLNLQTRWDLYWVQQSEKDDIESISDINQVKKLA
jgi:addiction module HigA family antidote